MSSYHHFTLVERESLHIGIKLGKSMRKIAKELNKSPSSISRELKRNRNKDASYNAWRGCILYIMRRKKCKRKYRLEADKELREWVIAKLSIFWSPETIVEKWKITHSNKHLSWSTIYFGLKIGILTASYTSKTHLRRRGKRQRTAKKGVIKVEHHISERPIEANNRERTGDWESDTVYGAVGKGFLSTNVDRKSRFLVAALLKERTSDTFNIETEKAFKKLKNVPIHTFTFDNGTEFAKYKEFETHLQATVYFADPHSPWQRGTNENTNDLIRFFFPKGTNFLKTDIEYLDYVVTIINNRPRKCLGWLSPAEVLFEECCT
jgi:IS30 family transposase